MHREGMDEIEVLRRRFCESLPEAPSDDFAVNGESVEGLLSAQGVDGSWGDIDYGPGLLKDWDAARHLRRVLRLAARWYPLPAEDGTRPALLDGCVRGLTYWFDLWPVNPNWWHNQIGAPTLLGDILLFLKDALEGDLIARAVPAFVAHRPALRFTGQNLVWVAAVQIRHGILVNEMDLIAGGFNMVGRELRIVDPREEGLQADMSFYQHGMLLYAGGYGQGFALDVARLAWIGDGTAHRLPAHKVELLTRFILDGSRWMIRGRTFELGAIGREISRKGHSADRFLNAARYLAQLDQPRREEVRALVAMPAAEGRSHVNGNRLFWRSDFMAHHREAFYVSVRVPSSRLLNADLACCGGEGRLCHHMAEGVSFIHCDGDEYRDIFPVWNWRQIPGATIEQSTGELDPEALRTHGASAFGGGASDGRRGCMGGIVRRDSLQARKGFFLFDEVMVAMGSGIGCASDAPVRTTINQCHWRGEVRLDGEVLRAGMHRLPAGSRVWHDRVAYQLLDGYGHLVLGEQHGVWSDCGVGSSELQALPVFNGAIDHGRGPADARYAYAIRPGVDAETELPTISILRHDREVLAVQVGERAQAIFFAPGEIMLTGGQRITAEQPCALLVDLGEDGVLGLTVGDPSQQLESVTLSLPGKRAGRLTVSLPQDDHAGSSVSLALY